jgi:hypothetical protein
VQEVLVPVIPAGKARDGRMMMMAQMRTTMDGEEAGPLIVFLADPTNGLG